MRIAAVTRLCVAVLGCALTASNSSAQIFTTILNFDYSNGSGPSYLSLSQGRDGKLYGTTYGGGLGGGTVFTITPVGALTTLYNFCSESNCTDGVAPYGGIVQAVDGNFYGATSEGGTDETDCFWGCGTVFKITPDGTLTTLHSFNSIDGSEPVGSLIQGLDGNLYGTTFRGGSVRCNNLGGDPGCGTVFRITPQGDFKTLYNFGASAGDGIHPSAGLIQGKDGSFYGTTWYGGNGNCDDGFGSGCGTVFKITPEGRMTVVYSFCLTIGCIDGQAPQGALVQSNMGEFYGTTSLGGAIGAGSVFRVNFRGMLTTLHSFGGENGAYPSGQLVQATDGNFYGTTEIGGTDGDGTLFVVTQAGKWKLLHGFTQADGQTPRSGLLQSTLGPLFGTTLEGGPYGSGTIFSLDMGLGPFVAFVRDSGTVGATGGILGQGFTGTTSVSLNGTPANFTVVSDTFLKATVPNGATSGFVTVATPSGTLTSNKPFRVMPQLLSFDPPSGPVGTQVTITGVSLTQTQGVGFGDRVPAQFTVNSDTQVTAIVPAGAKSGKIGIETKGGQAVSAGVFTLQ